MSKIFDSEANDIFFCKKCTKRNKLVRKLIFLKSSSFGLAKTLVNIKNSIKITWNFFNIEFWKKLKKIKGEIS